MIVHRYQIRSTGTEPRSTDDRRFHRFCADKSMEVHGYYLEEDLYIRSISVHNAGIGKKISWAWNNRVDQVGIYCIDAAAEAEAKAAVSRILRDPIGIQHGICSRFEYSVNNHLFLSPEEISKHSNPFAVLLLPFVQEKPILQNNGENLFFLYNVVGKITYQVKSRVLYVHTTASLPEGALGYRIGDIFYPLPRIYAAEENQFVLPRTVPAQFRLIFSREEDRKIYSLEMSSN